MSDAATRLLQTAKAIIGAPQHWTKKMCAANINGQPTKTTSPDATSFCAAGALHKALNTDPSFTKPTPDMTEAKDRLNKAAQQAGWRSIVSLNDDPNTTHATVLHIYDAAIAQPKPPQ